MQIRNLGHSGLRVSVVGLGCNNFGWRLDLEGTRKVIHAALDAGITLFDTADAYGNRGGSETLMGQVLGDRRKDIVLATKFALPMDDAEPLKGASRRYIMRAVEASLTRLKTDWIDLYQQHRHDPLTPPDETLRALEDLIRQGKIRYAGCSNFSGWQVVESHWAAKSINAPGFVSCQDEYSLLARGHEKELIPAMNACGMGLLPYFPLAAGMLTGKHRRGAVAQGTRVADTQRYQDRYFNDKTWDILEKLQDFCARRGRTMTTLAFSWLAAKKPVASVIAGATSPEQIAVNAASADWAMSAEDIAEVDKITA